MARPEEYGVCVRLITLDGENTYEGRVVELPDVATFGDSFEEAYEAALRVIETAQEVFAAKSKTFPLPAAVDDNEEFSGRVTLRMSKSLHRIVSKRAKSEGVSVNLWLVEAVAARAQNSLVSPTTVFAIVARPHVVGGVVTGNSLVFLPPKAWMSATPSVNCVVYDDATVALLSSNSAPTLTAFKGIEHG